jgi:16S rRNA (cytosine967-C5)-methyltransferase
MADGVEFPSLAGGLMSREVVVDALWKARQGKCTVAEALEDWIRESDPDRVEIRTAYEMALGTARRWIGCEALAQVCSSQGKISLGGREKALLMLAIYQLHYMDRPDYAVVDSTLQMAKRVSRPFLNGLLRNYCRTRPQIGTMQSYPSRFVEQVRREYPNDAEAILEAMNEVPLTTFRLRADADPANPIWANRRWLQESPWYVGPVTSAMEQISKRSDCSIQNITQIQLVQELASKLPVAPRRILDLCAAPGGKTLLLADTYPEAAIWANDISPKRVERLASNMEKYGIPAQISCHSAAELQTDAPFDLILVDAPCSNSGVLHRRPEARWRLDAFDSLVATQQQLLQEAKRLLAPGGSIWYMSCSILGCENSPSVEGLLLRHSLQILPNNRGWDGGYGAWLS